MHRTKHAHVGQGARLGVLLTTAAALALVAGAAFAGSSQRKGTVGATELQIPVGPRSVALGGAVASDVTGVEAMFWNPAGLASNERTEALFSHQEYFADMKVNYAGIAAKAGGFGSLGFAAKVLSIGDVIVTNEQAPEGTGEILNPTFTVLGVTWAKAFTDRVNFGATANYVNENLANNVATGFAYDFGVQYATGWNGLRIGMAMKNLGTSMKFEGPGFEILARDPQADPNAGNRGLSFSSATFEMPSYFNFTTSLDLVRDSQQALIALGAFQNNNFSGDNVRGGLEWSYRDLLALRGSYFGTFNGRVDATTGEETFKFDSGDDLYSGLALGAGIGTRFGEAGKIRVDAAWLPVREQFDDIIEVGLRIDF
jgi:hypothetical protein